MDPDSYLAQLRWEGGRLGTAARAAPAAPVPSCPGWDLRDLLGHVEALHRWVGGILRARATERPGRTEIGREVDFAELAAAYDRGLADLVGALAATDPEELVWNWQADGVAPARFWFRRMAQETAVHRWDAEGSLGPAAPFDRELAVDGIDEFLGMVAGTVARAPIAGLTGSLALEATDAQASWQLELAPDHLGREVAGPAPTTVRASASDLYLWLLHRIPPEPGSVSVVGDAAPVGAWGLVTFD